MLDRRAAPWPGAALTLALASGCAEPPSYTVRWQLRDGDEVFELTSVKQCADVGIAKVRVTTRRDAVVIDSREYPCFPAAFERDEGVVIPTLPPGEYAVDVEGLRRTGEPWACEEGQPCIAFAQDSVTIVEGELPSVEVELQQPPQCDDGIDNDLDGFVDGRDPACIIDATGFESADAELTLFSLSVSFLGSSVVFPEDVSANRLRLDIDGEQADGTAVDVLLDDLPHNELDKSQWPFQLPLLAHDLEPGSYVLSVVATDQAGNPVTATQEIAFEVPLAQFVLADLDFAGDQFLEPIEEPIAVGFGLLLYPGDEGGPPCELRGYLGGERVSIERMWMRVTDESDLPLDTATLSLTDLIGAATIMPVDEAGGWISLACPPSAIKSTDLLWGSYEIEVEARIGDVACFTSEGPRDLAPQGGGSQQRINLTRIVDDQGAPPLGCEECVEASDCSGQVCDHGICKDFQP